MDTRHKTQDAGPGFAFSFAATSTGQGIEALASLKLRRAVEGRVTSDEIRFNGSAIILAVVLTSLLAIVGAIFLLSSRVDSVATSAIADNKDLILAVDTVIARISEVLAADVPGAPLGGEYYDYPDANNAWLACLEPYGSAANPRWRQVSNIYGSAVQNMEARVLPDYNDTSFFGVGTAADADGDGVGDSIWVQVFDKTSSKGKPICAAIRIVDNSGMLNVNTGYKFDPNTSDGSSQTQINLVGLSWWPLDATSTYNSLSETDLRVARSPANPSDLAGYERDVIWRYESVYGPNTPFDVSDELESHYRFVINQSSIDTRLEILGLSQGRSWKFRFAQFRTPVDRTADLDDWFLSASADGLFTDPNDYAYRHIATIYNLDRIIAPDGSKMFNINSAAAAGKNAVHAAVRAALDPNMPNFSATAAQITANLIDYVDGPGYPASDPRYDPNNSVAVVYDSNDLPRLGFEQPCIYISELAQNFFQPDANEPNIIERSYAIEIYKPYPEDLPPGPNEWRLIVGSNPPINIVWKGNTWFNVFLDDVFNRINVDFNDFTFSVPSPFNGEIGVNPNVVLLWSSIPGATSYNIYLDTNQTAVFAATPNDIGVFQGNVLAPTTTFDPPGSLAKDTTFYWRIGPIGPGIVTRGLVWRFTVSDVNSVSASIAFDEGTDIYLKRKVPGLGPDEYVTVDYVRVPTVEPNSVWLKPPDPNDPNVRSATHSYQRDILPHKPIRGLWDKGFGRINEPTIGHRNVFSDGDTRQVQAHPANQPFTNVGQFGELFYASTSTYGGVGELPPERGIESQLRIDLALPIYQQVFKYLTVMDPTQHINDPCGIETRIKGRININTAPWFVIAQLPWVSEKIGSLNYDFARNIVAYRDKTSGPAGNYFTIRSGQPGFSNIGQLNLVVDPNVSLASIDCYWRDLSDLQTYPDLTTPDNPIGPYISLAGAIDDFEERDVIFSRISNLVTVRSDVFTAYILVRIGRDGPQKRVVAILDRSEFPAKPVKVLAIQSVPDPR